MRVKVPPMKGNVTPYLGLLRRLGIRQGKAANRTQSVEIKAGSNTGVNGEAARVNKF